MHHSRVAAIVLRREPIGGLVWAGQTPLLRTGLEMTRTRQNRGIHQGFDVPIECTVLTLLEENGRIVHQMLNQRMPGEYCEYG